MSTISKVFTILNVVLALFLLGTVASILARSDDYMKKYNDEVAAKEALRVDMQGQLDTVKSENGNLTSANTELRNFKSDLDVQIQNLTNERDQLRNDNNQLRGDVTSINGSLQNLQAQLAEAHSTNNDLQERNEGYRVAAASAEEAKLAAENDRARLMGDLERRDEDVAEYERQVVSITAERDHLQAERQALEAIGVPVATLIGSTVPAIEATVSDVGTGFVVLSVGEQDGVHVGYPFDVYRGGNYIGKVVVNQVFPDNSIARVVVKAPEQMFKALDNATTRL